MNVRDEYLFVLYVKGDIRTMKEQEKIIVEWEEEVVEDNSRVTAMYCFKSCSANEN